MRKVLFILSELADGDLDWMVASGTKQTCPDGTTLIEEGKAIEVVYVVLDGHLSVRLSAIDNKAVARLGVGEVVGELSFLDSRPASATVVTDGEATVLSIPRSKLTEKLEHDPPFAARFYRALGVFLAARLRRSQQQLGYGDKKGAAEDEDELDPALLASVALAGARFDWMMKRLRDAPSGGAPR